MPRADGTWGGGIGAQSGATLTATGCTLQGCVERTVYASDEGTTVTLIDSEVLDTARGRVTGFALGVVVQFGALISLSDSLIAGTEGPGVYVVGGGQASLLRSEAASNRFAGIVVLDGSVLVTSSTILDTLPDDEFGGGFGVYALAADGPPALTLTDTTIGTQPYAAIWLDGPGAYDIQGNTLSGGAGVLRGGALTHGNAVFAENGVLAWDGASGLHLEGNSIGSGSGISVLLDASSATLEGNLWSDDGADLRQQRCDGITVLTEDDVDDVPNSEICPVGNVLTAYELILPSLYLAVSATAE